MFVVLHLYSYMYIGLETRLLSLIYLCGLFCCQVVMPYDAKIEIILLVSCSISVYLYITKFIENPANSVKFMLVQRK